MNDARNGINWHIVQLVNIKIVFCGRMMLLPDTKNMLQGFQDGAQGQSISVIQHESHGM